MMPDETLAINKERGDFNLSNKFEYGHDNRGGIAARPVPIKDIHFKECLEDSKQGRDQSLQNRELIEKQNFTI